MSQRLLTAIAVLATAAFAQDYKVITKHEFADRKKTETLFSTPDRRLRREINGDNWLVLTAGETLVVKSGVVAIYDCNGREVVLVDPERRQFSRHRLPPPPDTQQMRAEIERLSKLPPRSEGSIETVMNTVDTGKRKQLFGHTASKFKTETKMTVKYLNGGRTSTNRKEEWYLDIEVPTSCETQEERELQRKLADLRDTMIVGVPNGFSPFAVVRQNGVVPAGLLVETTNRADLPPSDGPMIGIIQTHHSKVVKLEDSPLDRTLFQVPPGYAEVSSVGTPATAADLFMLK